MSKLGWFWAVFWAVVGMLNLWVFLAGFVSGDVVSMVGAIFVAFVYPSLFLTSVKSDHIVKRALEVIFMLLAFGAVIYGYVVTGSLILGVMAIFIVTMVFVAFIISYLLPRIRSESSARG
jgi:hypothetical protein